MGGNDDYSDQLAEQNRQTQQEIEQKKQSLFQTRLDIIKGQGAQSWTPRPLQAPEEPIDMVTKGRTAQAKRNQQLRERAQRQGR